MAEICVWVGDDRNVLDPMERLDGHVTAVKPDGWPWTAKERGGNHRVIKRPGVDVADLQWLLEIPVENDVIVGRRRYRLSSTLTTELKATREGRTVTKTRAQIEATRPARA